MAIQFLRCNTDGFEANKATFKPANGQPVFNTDSSTLYIGDGETVLSQLPSLRFEKPNVGTITQPSITLTLTPSSKSGEIGSPWPTISKSVSTNTGKYTYGPTPTGVQFTGSPVYSPTTIEGVFGDSSQSVSVSQDYSAGEYALDDRGTESTSRIEAGTATDTATFTGTADNERSNAFEVTKDGIARLYRKDTPDLLDNDYFTTGRG